MRRLLLIPVIIFCAVFASVIFKAADIYPEQNYIMLEDFQNYGSDPFSKWQSRSPYADSVKIYSVVSEGDRKFLRASTLEFNQCIQIGKLINENKLVGSDNIWWDIYRYPYLNWDWRIHVIPEGGSENARGKNDSAAGIYVVFQRNRIPVLGWQNQPADWLKYVWSTTLPAGTIIKKSSKKAGITLYEGRYVVVASGKKNMKKWVTIKRNVLQDYRNMFGRTPKFQPSVIGILSDSNSTKSGAMADYDNIRVTVN